MFEISFTPKAEQQLKKLEKEAQKRILAVLERARVRPEAHFKRLVGEKAYRLRAGDYRIIADINPNRLIILVLKLGHRKNIYKK